MSILERNILEELTIAGSMFGPQRMDLIMIKDQQRGADKELNREADEELKRYRMLANNLGIVAVLIATVTFAAGFTLPGGYLNDDSNQEEGMAILAKKLAFKMLLISDTIAMVSSICVTFLLIYSASFDQDIKLYSIFTAFKFMWIALGGMGVAFSMGIYVVLESKCRWLAILICGMAGCIPFIAWTITRWPTFGSIKG